MQTSKLDNKNILIEEDYFSKWLEAVPLLDKSADTVTKELHLFKGGASNRIQQ